MNLTNATLQHMATPTINIKMETPQHLIKKTAHDVLFSHISYLLGDKTLHVLRAKNVLASGLAHPQVLIFVLRRLPIYFPLIY